MLFSSIPFLFYYLTAVLFLYFISPGKLKNAVLMLSSLVFYAWGEPKYVVLMVISILQGYIFGILIEKYRGTKRAKLFLVLSIVVSVGFLGYFKYADFFIENFNAVTGLGIPLLRIALPIGISFYTFQILSYDVDVYRGDAPAQKNIVNLAAYITMFPQLIAGPIVRYLDIEAQLVHRTHTVEKFALGARRFVIGLSKKILLANVLGELCDIFKNSTDKSVLFVWMYAISYMLHVYFDFSGYSDMAIGLGKMFAFDFLENFNYPYIANSVTDFWRRWHMSLGSWFRDYVYIPLGGNRVGLLRHFFNIFVVWMLTGFWHGAAWNFIVWGVYFAIILMVEKVFLLKYLKKCKVINHIYVLLLVMVSFVIFDNVDMRNSFYYLGAMFGGKGLPFVNTETLYYLKSYAVVLVIGIIGATTFVKNTILRIKKIKVANCIINLLEPVFLMLLLVLCTAYLVDGSYNPFLYFRF